MNDICQYVPGSEPGLLVCQVCGHRRWIQRPCSGSRSRDAETLSPRPRVPESPRQATSRLACVHRAAMLRRLDGCAGCTEPPPVFACLSLDVPGGECVVIRDGSRRRKAIEKSGLPICAECNFREVQ
jgi:hypothetical protein